MTVRRSLIKNSYYDSSYTSENIPGFPTIDEEMENDVCKVSIGMDNSFIIGVGSKYCNYDIMLNPFDLYGESYQYNVLSVHVKLSDRSYSMALIGDAYTLDKDCAYYAARMCDILAFTVNGVTYNDWFLPSRDELNLMYVNLHKAGLGGFVGDYLSSSEDSSYAYDAWKQDFKNNGDQYSGNRKFDNTKVRPVRAF